MDSPAYPPMWRTGLDSNQRGACAPTRLATGRYRPLRHPSFSPRLSREVSASSLAAAPFPFRAVYHEVVKVRDSNMRGHDRPGRMEKTS